VNCQRTGHDQHHDDRRNSGPEQTLSGAEALRLTKTSHLI
jgi:hypothetical protein